MNKFMKKAEGFFTSRGFSAGVLTALVIALVVVVNIVIYALTSIFGLYLYSPVERNYGLSEARPATLEEAEKKGEKVTITFCMAKDDVQKHTTGMYVHETAKAYDERYDFVEIRYVNLLTQMETLPDGSRRFVDMSKYKQEMNKPDGTKGAETTLLTSSVIFEHEKSGNYRVLTDVYTTGGFADFYTLDSSGQPYAYSGEEIMGAMISWVCQNHATRKTAYFTENHGETVDVTFGNLLTAAGYYIDTVNLRTEQVPGDAGLVIISNPIQDFERGNRAEGVYTELERLEDYLRDGNEKEGGNLYVAIDPYGKKLNNLEAFLAERGISIAGESGEYGYSRELVLDPGEAFPTDSMSFAASFSDGDFTTKLIERFSSFNTGRVLLSRVAKLNVDESLGAETVLYSSYSSHLVRAGEVVNEDGHYSVAAYSKKSEGGGSVSEVFVVPSVLMTNSDILVAGGYSNRDFVYALLSEVAGADTAMYGTKSVIYDGVVENLTRKIATVYTVILLMIPTAVAVTGAVLVIRRKRR